VAVRDLPDSVVAHGIPDAAPGTGEPVGAAAPAPGSFEDALRASGSLAGPTAFRTGAAVCLPAVAAGAAMYSVGTLQAGAGLVAAVAALMIAIALAVAAQESARSLRPLRRIAQQARELAAQAGASAPAERASGYAVAARSLDALVAALRARTERAEERWAGERELGSDLQRRYALTQLLRNLAFLAREESSPRVALERSLQEIGNYLDWPIGRLAWAEGTQQGATGAGPRDLWFVRDHEGMRRFIEETERLAPGQDSLVARATSSCLPHWVSDLSRLGDWNRRAAAIECGLRSGLVIPLPGEATAGHIEFFSRHRIEAGLETLELVEAIRAELCVVADCDGGVGRAAAWREVEFDAALEGADVAVAWIARDGSIERANPVFHGLFCEPSRPPEGRSLAMVLLGEATYAGLDERIRLGELPASFACRARGADRGATRWAMVHLAGRPGGERWIAIARDACADRRAALGERGARSADDLAERIRGLLDGWRSGAAE